MSGIYDEINSKRYSDKDDSELSPKEMHARSVGKRGLLEEDQVRAALNSGQDPIDLSVLKWHKIKQVLTDYPKIGTLMGLENYIGYKTCALCITSIQVFKSKFGDLKDNASKCTVCPLARIEACVSTNSSYSHIDDAVTSATYGSSSPEREAALLEKAQTGISGLLENLAKLKQSST